MLSRFGLKQSVSQKCPAIANRLSCTKKKGSQKSIDGSSLIQEMRSKFESGDVQVHHNVPNEMPENELTLEE